MSEFCTCTLCGPCAARAEATANRAGKVTGQEDDPAKQEDKPQRPLGIAAAVVVYVLGDVAQGDGTTKRQVDLYSSMNGYHIRTIPATRWVSPVLLGAGEGLLAVVDRFSDHDLIRVTDAYGGAGAASFDDDGFPLDGVHFGQFQDIKTIPTPKGTHVTGLKILPRGQLIAGIDDGQGNCRYIKTDIKNSGYKAYEGELDTEDAFKALGTPVGTPASYDSSPSRRMHDFVHLVKTPDGAGAIHITNHLTGRVNNLMGLPPGTPLGIAHSSDFLTVLHRSTAGTTQLIRLPLRSNSYLLAGVEGDTMVPRPQEYQATHTFMPRDMPFPATATEAAVRVYLRQSGYINLANDADIPPATIARIAQLHAKGQPWLRMIDSASSTTLNDGRVQTGGSIEVTRGVGRINVPASLIALPDSSGLLMIESTYGTITELYNKMTADGDVDTAKPIFRSVHASHYDWLSEGGWTYGCATADSTTQDNAITNGLKGISIATDVSAEPGTLKSLPDFKALLVDAKTGLILYRMPKPQGVHMYGGAYASLSVLDKTTATESGCGVQVDLVASHLDGIDRKNNKEAVVISPETQETDPVYAFEYSNPLDVDFPWQVDRRRVTSTRAPKLVLSEESWTYRSTFGSIKPQWRGLSSPASIVQSSTFHYPGPQTSPVLQTSAYSGFFNLRLPKEQTTRCAVLAADLGDAQSLLADANNQLLSVRDQPDKYKASIAALTAQIVQLGAQIGSLQVEVAQCDITDPGNVIFQVPRPLQQRVFGPMALTPEQSVDPLKGASIAAVTIPGPMTPWTPANVAEAGTDVPTVRAVVVNPNIRSWIATEIKLVRNVDSRGDGCSGWLTPEARRGLFGARIGVASDSDLLHFNDGDAQSVCGGVHAGSVYDTGDFASGGVSGDWEITVLANGKEIGSFCEKVTFDQQIIDQAPSDLVESLAQTFAANVQDVDAPEGFYHKGKVYFTEEVVTTVQIKVKLVNYAFDVYRYGWRTVERGSPPGALSIDFNGYTRIGRDPGYYVDNNCEAFCVGNVFCNDFVFQGRKLCNQDLPAPVVRNVLWEGSATYTITNNPYENQGIGVGNAINAYFDFNLMQSMADYQIDIRHGEGRPIPGGICQNGGAG